jgi:PAS domain S-box-containing protein
MTKKKTAEMDKIKTGSGGVTDQRKRAEEILGAIEAQDAKKMTPKEIQQKLHELRVHQIELEMQNEELRRVQAELDITRESYFDLYDLAPVGYCTLSKQGMILEANLTAATMLGMVQRTLTRQPFSQFIIKEDQDIYYLSRKKLFATGELQTCEMRLLKKDGTIFWTQMEAVAAQAVDGAPIFRIVFSDISERKLAEAQREIAIQELHHKAEELQDKNEELERFTYSVSHDLKSPLVTIRTFVGILEQDLAAADKAKVKLDISYIRNSAEKMSKLLDELLNLSRIGHSSNPAEEVSLPTIVEEATSLVAGRITARGVKVVLAPSECILYGDRVRLVEVFQNLLDNACKFMGTQKSPLIEIGVETRDDEAVIYVRDNGSGIDPHFLPRIFIMFEKQNRGTEGDGVGLALVKRIVDMHGGRIWVESDGPGQGACFKFTLAGKSSAFGVMSKE